MNNREKAKHILNELIAKDLLTEEAENLLKEIK